MSSNGWTVDPAEIPEDGERYDMTLDKVGLAKIGPQHNRRQVIVVKAIIDNGEYAKKRVSNVFDPHEQSSKRNWVAFLLAIDHQNNVFQPDKEFIKHLNEKFAKDARFSAELGVHEFEDENKRGVRYSLTNFQKNTGEEAELTLRKEPTQFQREIHG